MPVCPHCGNKLELTPLRQVPWWKYDPGPKTNLGCGTLILIAILVAMFSSGNSESVARLEQQIRALEQKVDGLGKGIEKLLPPERKSDTPGRAQ